jgi:hypothetical protein
MKPANLPAVEPRTTIFRPHVGQRLVLCVLSHEIVAIQAHWTTKTRLCVADERCPACYQGLQPKWLGYLAVMTPQRVEGLLELSAHAGHRIAELGGDLYNHRIEVERRSKVQGATIVEVAELLKPIGTVWSQTRVMDQVCRLMQLPRLQHYLSSELWEQGVESAAIAQLSLDLAGPINASDGNRPNQG